MVTAENYPLFQRVLRSFSSILQTPVIILLILMIAFSMFCIGWILVEALQERRHLRAELPQLLDRIKQGDVPLEQCIRESGILLRQKTILLEILNHPAFTPEERESFADNLIEKEEAHYDGILKWTQTVSKLAPMAGLLGTLIPLGPGIIALGQGNVVALSQSMLTAFDTTVAGLTAAGICIVISAIRGRWYTAYMSDLQTLVDFVVKTEEERCR